MGNQDQARDFYQKVLQLVPSDVGLLVKLADLAADENDRKQSLNYLLEVITLFNAILNLLIFYLYYFIGLPIFTISYTND